MAQFSKGILNSVIRRMTADKKIVGKKDKAKNGLEYVRLIWRESFPSFVTDCLMERDGQLTELDDEESKKVSDTLKGGIVRYRNETFLEGSKKRLPSGEIVQATPPTKFVVDGREIPADEYLEKFHVSSGAAMVDVLLNKHSQHLAQVGYVLEYPEGMEFGRRGRQSEDIIGGFDEIEFVDESEEQPKVKPEVSPARKRK